MSVLQCSAARCSYRPGVPPLQPLSDCGGSTHRCTASNCTAPNCTALHCTALHCTALHCTALHCTALHCALHYTAMHHIKWWIRLSPPVNFWPHTWGAMCSVIYVVCSVHCALCSEPHLKPLVSMEGLARFAGQEDVFIVLLFNSMFNNYREMFQVHYWLTPLHYLSMRSDEWRLNREAQRAARDVTAITIWRDEDGVIAMVSWSFVMVVVMFSG